MSVRTWLTRGADKPGAGSHLQDRMHRILGTCHGMGLYREMVEDGRKRQLPLVRDREIVALDNAPLESYGLIVPPAALDKVLRMRRQFAHALNVPASDVSVRQEGDTVWVDVAVHRPGYLTYGDAWALAPDLPRGHVLLGVNGEGQQMTLDLERAPHCAIIGASGSGKSALLKVMIHSAQQRADTTVALFDPAGEFWPLSGFGNVWQGGMFRTHAEIEAGLAYLAARVREGQSQGLLFVFVDEAKELARNDAIRAALGTLGDMGRRYGVHLVLGAQSTKDLGAALLANCLVNIVGQMRDAQHAAFAAGAARTGAERLSEPGRFIVRKGSETRYLQAAMIPPKLLERLAWEWPPCAGVVPSTPSAVSALLADSHQAPAPVMQSTAAIPGGAPGRGPDDLPPAVRHAIVTHWRKHARPLPRRTMAAMVGVQDIDNDKRERWLDESLGRRWR